MTKDTTFNNKNYCFSNSPLVQTHIRFFLNVHEQTLFYSVLGPYLYVVVALYSLHFEGKWI